jgi:hypothetical protein
VEVTSLKWIMSNREFQPAVNLFVSYSTAIVVAFFDVDVCLTFGIDLFRISFWQTTAQDSDPALLILRPPELSELVYIIHSSRYLKVASIRCVK